MTAELNSEGETRDKFLESVRFALGRTEALAHMPDHPALKTSLPRHQEKLRTVRARLEARRPQLLQLLTERAAGNGWEVHRVATYREAGEVVGRVARRHRARRVVRSAEEVFRRVDVDRALRAAGADPIVLASGRQRRRSELRRLVWDADIGITGVEYAVAETGSCVPTSAKGAARLTSLVPPAYVAVVEAEQVLESVGDLMTLRRMDKLRTRGRFPHSYVTVVSGPSRSADTELMLTRGVSGPGSVYLVLIG